MAVIFQSLPPWWICSRPHVCEWLPNSDVIGDRMRAPTWVEVFGFGQLDGGARLFLQLYDGLAALANYRAGCIAGDQNLQEVLTLL